MARPRKTPAPAAPVWQQVGESHTIDGPDLVLWQHSETGETRARPAGVHPDQPVLSAVTEAVQPDEEFEETATDRLATMLELASDAERAELKVYRVAQGQLEWCANYTPEQFEDSNFETLRQQFGPGEYELRLYASTPDSRKFAVRRKTRITIAKQQGAAEQTTGLPAGLSQVLGTIAQGQAQMLDALVQMKQQPQKDPMEEMTKMLSMMTMMRQAMGIDNSSKSSIGEIVGAIKELRMASEEINPETEKDSLLSSLPQVLDLVKTGIQAQQQPAIIPGTLPGVQLPADIAAAPSVQMQPQENEQMQNDDPRNLRGLLSQLLAIRGQPGDIEKAALFIFSDMPDDIVEIMFSRVWWLALCTAAPEVKPHKAWLEQVRAEAMPMFELEDDEQPEIDEQTEK
jgi:hypothetical protein